MKAPDTVLVTGASSFMGMHLSLAFNKAGYKVIAAHSRSLESYDGVQKQRLETLKNVVGLVTLDLTSQVQVASILRTKRPQLLVHHAGYATNYASYDYDFCKSIEVNVKPLSYIYPVLQEIGSSIIITGSSAEYSSSDGPNHEDDVCWPDTPYGVSKLMETVMARQLAFRYNIPTRVARLYLPYGVFDNPQKLLPQVVSSLRQGRSIDLSPCDQKRDFILADDAAQIYLALAEDMPRQLFDVFNVGSGEAIELKQFLLVLAHEMNADPELLKFGARERRPGEPEFSYGSAEKVRQILNHQVPKWDKSLAANWRVLAE
ncbi:MAG: NAD-dependent epimerase/dehydratase family protein [Acidobacteriota bacterium]